jgi:hypothetical protein
MHSTLAAVTPLLFLSSIAEARHGRGRHEAEANKNWAGVNSFFLHAFPEYAIVVSLPNNGTDSNLTDQTVLTFSMPSKPLT